MSRCQFSKEQMEQLKRNPNVVDVNEKRITYSSEFKQHFIDEYKKGIKPKDIFKAAGFDTDVLGTKRIQRACERWREGMMAGTSNQGSTLKIQDEALQKQLDRLCSSYEKKLASKQARIERLEAENELLKKIGRVGGKKCEKKVYGRIDLYNLVKETVQKYKLHRALTKLCKAVGLARSDYYYYESTADKRSLRQQREAEYTYFVKKAFDSCKYKKNGARSIKMILQREFKQNYSRKKIGSVMRNNNLVCAIKRANPYRKIWKATKEDKIAPNLVKRQFKTGEARKVFLADITYIKHQGHYSYVSLIIDAQTREPVAHESSTSLKMDFVINCLKQLEECGWSKGAIIHSDQGVHYTSKEFREKVKQMGLVQSMSRRGNCLDNSPTESFIGHMKQEMDLDENASDAEIEKAISDYINDYRYHRYQKGLGGLTPYEYALKLLSTKGN